MGAAVQRDLLPGVEGARNVSKGTERGAQNDLLTAGFPNHPKAPVEARIVATSGSA